MARKNKQKIAIIGAGFTGLSAAWDLVNNGFDVEVFEANKFPGGLAAGLKDDNWDWSIEHHYHHVFQTDEDVKGLLSEMGLLDKLFFKKVVTSSLYEGEDWQIDSPVSLLLFKPIPFFSRLRVGAVIALMKIIPNGRFLERFSAKDFLRFSMGEKAWQVLWKPLFVGKFGGKADKINMAWFWARIATRSQKLGYYEGGFLKLAEDMTEVLKEKGVVFHLNKPVKKIVKKNKKINLSFSKNNLSFDKVFVTVPFPILSKMMDIKSSKLGGLSARTLLLEMDKKFFANETYWLSIHEEGWPFLAVVEHTNLIDKNNYGNRSLVYVGKYLDKKDPFYKLNKNQVIKKYKNYLNKLSPGFEKYIKRSWIFDADFAQPLVYKNHSKLLPPIELKEGVYWLSMQHVYPWDRGINYAVRFGRKVLDFIK
jgi:protoporphyrinogen oxidase